MARPTPAVLVKPVACVQLAPSSALYQICPLVVPVVALCVASSERTRLCVPVMAIDQMYGASV